MGRTASITKTDVAKARAHLSAESRPHGIIAIRNYLGRGSPQLIGRLLREIDQEAFGDGLPGGAIDVIASRLTEVLTARLEGVAGPLQNVDGVAATGPLARSLGDKIAENEAYINQLQRDLVAIQRQATVAEAEATVLREANAHLREELAKQRENFEIWRRDHVYERALLANRIEHLNAGAGTALSKPSPQPQVSTGAQLDLYASDDDSDTR